MKMCNRSKRLFSRHSNCNSNSKSWHRMSPCIVNFFVELFIQYPPSYFLLSSPHYQFGSLFLMSLVRESPHCALTRILCSVLTSIYFAFLHFSSLKALIPFPSSSNYPCSLPKSVDEVASACYWQLMKKNKGL